LAAAALFTGTGVDRRAAKRVQVRSWGTQPSMPN
jgi:hypothetical protein